MKTIHNLRILLINISDIEKARISRSLSTIELLNSGEKIIFSNDHKEPADLAIVNSDSDEAIKIWVKYFLSQDKQPIIPSIFTGKRRVKANNTPSYSTPLRVSNILGAIQRLWLNKLKNDVPKELFETYITTADKLKHDTKKLNREGLRAIVADDSTPSRMSLVKALKQMGYEVDSAECGEEVISLCDENVFNIVFLDVIMPDIDGYKVCKKLKKNRNYKNTPVIMVTGKDGKFDKIKGSLSGCDTYLVKPFKREDLEMVTQKYLDAV